MISFHSGITFPLVALDKKYIYIDGHFNISLSPQGDTVFDGVFVCQQLYSIHYEWILMKFSGSVRGGTRNNPLDFESYR